MLRNFGHCCYVFHWFKWKEYNKLLEICFPNAHWAANMLHAIYLWNMFHAICFIDVCRAFWNMSYILLHSLCQSPFVNKSVSTEQLKRNIQPFDNPIHNHLRYLMLYIRSRWIPTLFIVKTTLSTSCQLCMLCVRSCSTGIEFLHICSVPEQFRNVLNPEYHSLPTPTISDNLFSLSWKIAMRGLLLFSQRTLELFPWKAFEVSDKKIVKLAKISTWQNVSSIHIFSICIIICCANLRYLMKWLFKSGQICSKKLEKIVSIFLSYLNNFCTGSALCNRDLFDEFRALKVQILSNTIMKTTLYKFILQKNSILLSCSIPFLKLRIFFSFTDYRLADNWRTD